MQDFINNNVPELVQLLSKGNLLAFNALYKMYSGMLYRFSYGYLKSEEEAEELIQEVFTRIWEKRSELKEELSFESFLFTIAFNIIKKHFRTKSYLSNYFNANIVNDQDMQTSHKISYNSLYQYIMELANQLPERRREIFMKSRFQELSVKEIAEEMKISHKTVENQLTEALKFIRINLNRENMPAILFFMLFIS